MEQTNRLCSVYKNMRSYDFSSPAIVWDRTWAMECTPYPPAPCCQLLVERGGVITHILELWEAYMEALFHFARLQGRLGTPVGQVLVGFFWLCEDGDDWRMSPQDARDLLALLAALRFDSKSRRRIQAQGDVFLPAPDELEAIRAHLIQYLNTHIQKGATLYFRRD